MLAKGEDIQNAEERRLFYVAVTRAKKHVYILTTGEGRPSEFLTEIQQGNYEIENDSPIEGGQRCPSVKPDRSFSVQVDTEHSIHVVTIPTANLPQNHAQNAKQVIA